VAGPSSDSCLGACTAPLAIEAETCATSVLVFDTPAHFGAEEKSYGCDAPASGARPTLALVPVPVTGGGRRTAIILLIVHLDALIAALPRET
jgi:hypothetical protein